ncbi:50S ribosomal protein L9 [Aerococcaceae bacterium DSM 111020]|nr:50S ribosomal protein L9 [Aerococcaceae bacterium DSM 111020]
MKVILLEDVKKQGKKGQVIEVSDGYGRNYLIKNGLAKEATKGALNQLRAKEKANQKQAEEELEQAKQLKKEIEADDTVVKVKAKSGEDGRLFGTITSKQIAENLEDQFKIKVDRRKIDLANNLAALGNYQVPVKLHPEVEAKIYVHVIEE